jgi:NAD+ kinase
LKNRGERIRRVGLVGNVEKPACARVVRAAAGLIREAGRQVAMDAATQRLTRQEAEVHPDAAALAGKVDLLLVCGGDGTMLRVAREIAGLSTPILGINIGGLGFLTAVSSRQLPEALDRIWAGRFTFERRTLLEATAEHGGRRYRCRALNDVVISHGSESRLIDLDVTVDGDPVTCYRGDGLVISSPTGSTAYSLAAGGAIVLPTAQVIALTPICPHTLSNRPLILNHGARIEVKVLTQRPTAVLSADGELITELVAGDRVLIRRSRHTVRLMHLTGSSFFEALRSKLHWRGTTL